MNRFSIPFTLAVALAFPAELAAHGGTYRGPGDTVPPGGGHATPPTGTSAPPTPIPGQLPNPITGALPGVSVTPPNVPIPVPIPRGNAVTPPSPIPDDLTRWVFWWEFNKEPFLNLKARIHSAGPGTSGGPLAEGLQAFTSENRTFQPTLQQITQQVIPALRQALESADSIDIQSSCLVALAKVGLDPTVVDLILPRLRHPHQEVAETAALALGILQDPVVLPELEALALDSAVGRQLTGDENGVRRRTRAFAVYGLGLVAYASPEPALRRRIADTLWSLVSEGPEAAADLKVSAVVSLGLARLEDPEPMVRRLSEILADPDQNRLVRAHCPNAIAKLLLEAGDPGPVDRWTRELLAYVAPKSKAPNEVRQSVVQACGLLARQCTDGVRAEIGDTLMRLAEDGADLQERNLTSISLAYLGAALPEAHPQRDQVVRFLLQQHRKGSRSYRPWAGLALGVMAHHMAESGTGALPPVAGESLLESFEKERNPSRKAAYAISLGLMRFGGAKGAVAEAMRKSGVDDLRGYCAVSLGLLGAREHRETIQEIVRESRRRPEILRQAAIGLGLMDDHEVVDTLLALLQPVEGRQPSLSVLSSVATAIGFIGDHRSVAPLVALLADDRSYTPLGRAFAAAALGLVVDKELLPWNSKIGQDLNYRAAVGTLVDQSSGTGVLDIL